MSTRRRGHRESKALKVVVDDDATKEGQSLERGEVCSRGGAQDEGERLEHDRGGAVEARKLDDGGVRVRAARRDELEDEPLRREPHGGA